MAALGDQLDRDTAQIVGLKSSVASLKDRLKAADSSLAQCEKEKKKFRVVAECAASDAELNAKQLEKCQAIILGGRQEKATAEQKCAEMVQLQLAQAAEHTITFSEAAAHHEAIIASVVLNTSWNIQKAHHIIIVCSV